MKTSATINYPDQVEKSIKKLMEESGIPLNRIDNVFDTYEDNLIELPPSFYNDKIMLPE